jgi:mannose-1-phosphate guanylyltransferase
MAETFVLVHRAKSLRSSFVPLSATHRCLNKLVFVFRSQSMRVASLPCSLTGSHERHYRDLLKEILPENLVIQPENRGTASAILYALLRLSKGARDRCVALFPSDHFVSDDCEFMRHVDLAFNAVGSRPETTVLLGITPQTAESGYGWIEPGERLLRRGPLFCVRRFWEKPRRDIADELLRVGCTWNSFVMVARVSTLIGLIMVALPQLFAAFSKIHHLLGSAREPGGLERLYERIPTASFSDEALERYPINLSVLPVHGVEWSDLGEPLRVIAVLSRLGLHPEGEAAQPLPDSGTSSTLDRW